ncbi:MAG: YraN family protein [Muribaculaceae bacterium]|nr:YraN family protein [Muribaculaceae bacterium]
MKKEADKKKIAAYEWGRKAEDLVVKEYIKQGYTVLERNWKLGKTEIDIIVQKDSQIILVEVKARVDLNLDPLEAVTSDKRKRMVKAADAYIQRLQGLYDYRFDIASCSGTEESYKIEILKDAFVSADMF